MFIRHEIFMTVNILVMAPCNLLGSSGEIIHTESVAV